MLKQIQNLFGMRVLKENKMKKAMKNENILIVHNYYQISGGEDTVVANEIRLLKEHGHEVFLYTRNNSELKSFSKFRKLFLPITTVFNPKTYKDVKKIIKENNIDVVHVHNTLNLVSPSVYYAARNCKVPIVQTVHNFRLLCPAATFYRDGNVCEDCVEKGLFCAVKNSCYRESKLQTLVCVISTEIHRALKIYSKINYICLTEFNRQKLLTVNGNDRRKIFDEEKIFIKPNMVFLDEDKPDVQKEDYFLFVGRVEKIKGMDILIQAFENLPLNRLFVAGTGNDFEYYQNMVKQKGLQNIEFLGFQQKQQLQMIMQKAKAIIVPSQWYEGFPMTIVEAFSLGVPVIGADIGNVGSLIKDGINGWKFKYDSSEDLQAKITECCEKSTKQLRVVCDEELLPNGNYQKLIKIYKCAIENN